MTTKNKESYRNLFAPINPDGPIPPGLIEEHLADAYRSVRKDLRPKKILRLLGVKRQSAVTKADLRREMNDPDSRLGHDRDGRVTKLPPLCTVLYFWLKQQQWATKAYEEIVEPAEVGVDDGIFLDTKLFDATVKKYGENLSGDPPELIDQKSFQEALALFALAYGLLQPDDAEVIVTSATGLGDGFDRFFGGDDEFVNAAAVEVEGQATSRHDRRRGTETPPEGEPAWTSSDAGELHAKLRELRTEIQSWGMALVEAGTQIQERVELPSVEVFEESAELQDRLNSLRNATQRILKASGLDDSVTLGNRMQTGPLLGALDTLQSSLQSSQRVTAVLNKIPNLQHRESGDSALFELCRAEAEELQHAQDAGKPDPRLAEVAKGTHPLAQLVKFVEELDSLTDEHFERLQTTVAEAYGRKLARLVSRGSLVVAQVEQPRDPQPQSEGSTELIAGTPSTGSESVGDATRDPATTEQPITPPGDAQQDSELETNTQLTGLEDSKDLAETVIGPAKPTGDAVPSETSGPLEFGNGVGEPASREPELQTDEPLQLFAAAWELMEQGRLSLAYQLSRTLEVLHPSTVPHLPSDAVRVAMLSPLVQSSTGPLTHAAQTSLRRVAENLEQTKSLPEPVRVPLAVIVVCSSLRPALLAPATDAVSLLASLTVPGKGLRQLQHAVMRHAQLGLDLNPSVLKGIKEHAQWDKLVVGHCDSVGRWLLQNRQGRIIYAPTTKIWRNWLQSNGLLGAALQAVGRDDRSSVSLVKQTAEAWSDPGDIRDQVAKTDRSLRQRFAGLRPIDARALTSIVSHAQQAVGLLVGWLALLNGKPVEGGFSLKQADSCRSDILAALGPAGTDIDALLSRSPGSVYARAAHAVVTNLLASLEGLFDPKVTEPVPPPSAGVVCGLDLLRVPQVSVNSDWEPLSGRTEDLLLGLTATAERQESDWTDVLEMKTQEGDHLSTERILDLLEANVSVTDERLETLRSQRDRNRRRSCAAFEKRVEEVRARIVRAAWYDVLPESVFLDLKGHVDLIQPDQILDFREAERDLDEVCEKLKAYDAHRVEQVRERLSEDLPDAKDDVRSRVEDALSNGNVAAANEYIDFAIQGRTVDVEDEDEVFAKFFPGFIREINAFLGGDKQAPEVTSVINQIRGNKLVGPVDMRSVRSSQAADASRMLEAWLAAKERRGPAVTKHLTELFEAIGFESVRIGGSNITRADRWWGTLKVSPIADREICSVPHFGSSAQGQYRVLCCWDRPSEEEIINAGGRERTTSPLIVVYFGRMTESRRRDLAYLSRSRKKSLLVVDEIVIWFLCPERGARLPRLFRALLPFTAEDPYITTASLLPPEMFFGRTLERQSIVDQFGTNLVYGGRQLGKTALLRDVERSFHSPGQGVIVRWLDLLAEHVGLTRPIEDIWAVIADLLQSEGVLKSSTVSSQNVVRQVRDWLNGELTRRIVLLLDEADEFLRSDAEHQFKNLVQLKGLMDTTGRRFKVVFSGLHNVQRSSRDPNTPFAHLGQPLCIGPLLKGADAAQAVALITRPLGDLGYRFESADLPMRILSHTNYYPSLIQIYCKHLLSHLTDQTRPLFDPKKSPPYLIRGEHLEAVQNEELREKILDKFKLTLDLDPRYRVIALFIALETIESRERGSRLRGVDPQWVRQQALEWWPIGFEDDMSPEGFKTILDEMIGLGVLRKNDAHTYTLRSPNLANLLGGRKEIDAQLLDAADREPPAPYEALHFRRGIADAPTVRSPLTAQQEAELTMPGNDVVLVCGSRLAEMDEIGQFLPLASPDSPCDVLQTSRDVGDVADCVGNLRRSDARLSLVVVSSSCGWDDSWVFKTLELVTRKTSRKRFMRVVFVADPQQVWSWTAKSSLRRQLLPRGVRELSLRPWTEPSLRRWLDDLGIALGEATSREQIRTITGAWASPLRVFADRCQQESHRWQLHLTELEAALLEDPSWRKRLALRSEALVLFRTMADLAEPALREELGMLVGDVCPDQIDRVLLWAELLSYVRKGAGNKWELDSLIARMLPAR